MAAIFLALGLTAFAIALIAVGHLVPGEAQLLVFGPIVLALAIVVDLIIAGLRHPIAILVTSFALVIFLVGVTAFNWFGLAGVL